MSANFASSQEDPNRDRLGKLISQKDIASNLVRQIKHNFSPSDIKYTTSKVKYNKARNTFNDYANAMMLNIKYSNGINLDEIAKNATEDFNCFKTYVETDAKNLGIGAIVLRASELMGLAKDIIDTCRRLWAIYLEGREDNLDRRLKDYKEMLEWEEWDKIN